MDMIRERPLFETWLQESRLSSVGEIHDFLIIDVSYTQEQRFFAESISRYVGDLEKAASKRFGRDVIVHIVRNGTTPI